VEAGRGLDADERPLVELGEGAQIWSIRSSTPGRSGSRYIREEEIPSS
jgi:hypothetical protein